MSPGGQSSPWTRGSKDKKEARSPFLLPLRADRLGLDEPASRPKKGNALLRARRLDLSRRILNPRFKSVKGFGVHFAMRRGTLTSPGAARNGTSNNFSSPPTSLGRQPGPEWGSEIGSFLEIPRIARRFLESGVSALAFQKTQSSGQRPWSLLDPEFITGQTKDS